MTEPFEPLSRDNQSVAIIGAGLAGLRVAEGLRGAGFAGRIALIGEELHEPYDRPPLSKAVLEIAGHEHTIKLAPGEALSELELELHLGRRAVRIEREKKIVVLSDGACVAFDRLVLATGSRARTLDLFPRGAPGVFYLRDLEDALALRAALTHARRLFVVGGGVIGLEVAATARSIGCEVMVIEAAERVMSRAASPTIADYILARHRDEGVDIRLGVTVVGYAAASTGRMALSLSNGETPEADAIVVGVGVIPNLELARDCGLAVSNNGVIADGFGATSDPCIYAAGEVAAHYNAGLGRHDRQETWNHAATHGEHVGRALIGAIEPFGELGSYWSDQYDINLQTVGAPIGKVDVVRGDPSAGGFLVFHIADGHIVGVSAVNAVRELRKARKLIGAAAPTDLNVLADSALT